MLLHTKLGLYPEELFTIPGTNTLAYFDEEGKFHVPTQSQVDPQKLLDLYQTLILNIEELEKIQCFKFIIKLVNILRVEEESFHFNYDYGFATIYFGNYELNLSIKLSNAYPFEKVFIYGKNFLISDIKEYLKL